MGDLHRSDTFLNTATPDTDKCTEGNHGDFCRKVVKLLVELLLKFIVKVPKLAVCQNS